MTPDCRDPGDCRGSGDEFQIPQTAADVYRKIDFGAPLEGRFSRIFKKGARRDPMAPHREPKRPQGRPKASQTRPKAPPKKDKRSPMAPQRDSKEHPATQKGVQRKPIYTKTPDQPHQRPLCKKTLIKKCLYKCL